MGFLFCNGGVAAGVGLFLGSSVFYLLGLKRGEVSVLYPMVSLANVWTLIWSRLFFKEPITHAKTLGLLLILAGVVFIGAGAGPWTSSPVPAVKAPEILAGG